MPFKKQTEKILAGSLNLLPPGDLVPPGDSLQLQNWRMDQAGQLRSRQGMSAETGVLAGTFTNFAFFRSGSDRYAAVAGNLRYGTDLASTIAGGFLNANGTPGFASMQDKVWIMNPFLRLWVRSSTVHQWGIPGPSTAPTLFSLTGGGSLPEGDYSYWVTFVNDEGHESSPSDALDVTITAGSSAVVLTGIAVSGDAQVTGRNIYRLGGGVNSPLLAIAIPNNSDTSIIDYGSASTLYGNSSIAHQQAQNREMPEDNDAPPPCYGMVGPYFGRLIAFRSADFPGRYWWSKTAQPWAWPGADDDFEGNWQDVGDSREAILTAGFHKRMIIFYKENSIWRLEGDPDDSDPEQTNSDVGIVGPAAFAQSGGFDYFGGPEGIYSFNGDREQIISDRIAPIFKGEYTKIGDVYVPPLHQAYRANMVMAARFGRLYVSYPSASNVFPNTTLVYDIETKRWGVHKVSTGVAVASDPGFLALYSEGTTGAFMGAVVTSSGVKAYSLEQGTADAGSPIPLIWQSRFTDQGQPDREKVYQDLTIASSTADGGEAAPAALTVKAIYDDGSLETLGSISSTDQARKTFTLGSYPGRMARNLSIRIEGDVVTTARILECSLNYYLEPRRARNWDSGVIDFGTRELKDLLALELEIDTNSTVTLTIHNDTAGAMSIACSGTFPATSVGRMRVMLQAEVLPYNLYTTQTKSIDARRYRFLLSVPEGKYFKLHGMRAKIRPSGVYLDQNEFWKPDPIHL